MRKYLTNIFIALLIVGAFFSPFSAPNAYAAVDIFAPLKWVAGAVFDFGRGLVAPVAYLVFALAASIMKLAGNLLDQVVQITVLNMRETIAGSGINIEPAWRVLRDFVNTFFIFSLLYIGFSVILGTTGGNTKRYVVNLIVAALLINFSLFFTRVLIDASNIIALQFFKFETATPGLEAAPANVSDALMQSLRLQSIFDPAGELAANVSFSSEGIVRLLTDLPSFTTAMVIFTIIVFIAAFIFFIIAALLLVRFVVLVFLMALSPLMFIGMIIPALKKITGEWWETLFRQAFFAPVFFILLWVFFKIVNTNDLLGGSAGARTFSELLASGASTPEIGVLFNYGIVIIFLIAALVGAKKIALDGGGLATKGAAFAAGAAGGFFMRNTAGRLGERARRWGESIQRSQPKSRTGRFARGALVYTGAAKGMRYGGEKAEKAPGMFKVGDRSRYQATTEKRRTQKEEERKVEEDKREREVENKKQDLALHIRSGDNQKIEETIKGMQVSDVKDLDGKTLTDPKVLPFLTGAHYDAIAREGKLSGEDLAKIRNRGLEKNISAADAQRILGNISDDTLTRIDGSVLAHPNIAQELTLRQLRRIGERGRNLTPDDRANIRTNILEAWNRAGQPTSGNLYELANFLTNPRGANLF